MGWCDLLVRGGACGKMDGVGYRTIKNKLKIQDPHATMLQPPGINRVQPSHQFGDPDIRLAGVYPLVIEGILVQWTCP